MRLSVVVVAAATSFTVGTALAKLPPPSEEAKAKAAETTARNAWSDKVGAFKLCQTMDQVASVYRAKSAAAGRPASGAAQTPPCADPGPFVPPQITPATSKPLEASGAHSPPGTATTPPSNKATSAEMTGTKK
jgi:hypothetical protein